MGNPEGERPSQDRPVGQLIRDAAEQMSRLAREEMRLAQRNYGRKQPASVSVSGCSVPVERWASMPAQPWSAARSWEAVASVKEDIDALKEGLQR